MLREQVRAVVRSQANLQDAPPTAAQVGARLVTDDGAMWLVVPAPGRARCSVRSAPPAPNKGR